MHFIQHFYKGLILLLLLFSACESRKESNKEEKKTQTSQKDSLQIQYAKGFQVEYGEDFKIVRITHPFKESQDSLLYILYPRGGKKPEGFAGAVFVEIPLRKIVISSTTHAALMAALGEIPSIAGVSDGKYIGNPEIRQAMKEGKILETGGPSGINQELLFSIQPDALMLSGMSAKQLNSYSNLNSAGIQVIVNAEWLENTPLGRAEWLKFMAVFYNKEKEASAQFDKIAAAYNQMKAIADKAKEKPLIIAGLPFKDTWYMSGGKSYMAQFFKDAHCEYHWANNEETGSIPLSFEAAYPIALKAEYWLGVGTMNDLKELLSVDPRYADFNSYKKKQLYNNNKRSLPEGGNDFWESGFLNPDKILGDMIKITHPELLPDYELYYYKKLE